MAKARKKAKAPARKKVAARAVKKTAVKKTSRKAARKPAKAARKPAKAARKPAKAARKPAKAARKPAKARASARKAVPKAAARRPQPVPLDTRLAKVGISQTAKPRPGRMEIKLPFSQPEPSGLTREARRRAAMPLPVSTRTPIAPMNLRAAPATERRLRPHDREE